MGVERTELRTSVRQLMEQNWNGVGYTAPNPVAYPWLWLWDSCFHSLIWAELGEEQKALLELETALGVQNEEGFVAHMNSVNNPQVEWHKLWGNTHNSCITQPPMFGHTIAELAKLGVSVREELVSKAQLGLKFLTEQRRSQGGLIYLVHPWESGMDDSPRWDDYLEGDFDKEKWLQKKLELVNTIEFSKAGSPIFNPAFPVRSVSFNALVAFNIFELERLTGKTQLTDAANEITDALENCFEESKMSWVDPPPIAGSEMKNAGAIRTLDALLVGLVSSKHHDLIQQQLTDLAIFGGDFGPSFVHRCEPCFSSNSYWRGSVWPQLTYLFCKMLEGTPTAEKLAQSFLSGVVKSNFSEHWDANSGKGLGAKPQSWSGLALLTISKK